MERLSDLYAAAKTNRIYWHDQIVFGMLRITVQRRFKIRFLESVAEPPQGVRLNSRHKMSVQGGASKLIAVWSEGDREIEVTLPVATPQEIKVSNIWRYSNGAIQTWYGNYGMLVQRDKGTVEFRCSDGRNYPTFDDLSFAIDGVFDTEPLA